MSSLNFDDEYNEETPIEVEDEEDEDFDDFFGDENEESENPEDFPDEDENEEPETSETNEPPVTEEDGKVKLSEEVIKNLKKFIKDRSFTILWQQLKGSISDTLDSMLNKSDDKEKLLTIKDLIIEMLNSSTSEIDFTEVLSLTEVENNGLSELTSSIIDFLSTITVLSLLGGLDTDIDTNLCDFGFYDFASNLTGMIAVAMDIDHDIAKSKFLKGILANTRSRESCEHLNSYIAQGNHYKDINYIIALLDKKEQNKYEDALHNVVTKSARLTQVINDARDSIMGIYDALFQDGTGVKTYYGVLTKSNGNFSYTLRNSNGDSVENIATDEVFNDDFEVVLSGLAKKGYNLGNNILISENRQFDEQLIVDSDKPVYFPRKILEFAMCMKATENQSVSMYTPADLKGGYAESKFRKDIRNTVTRVLKNGVMYLIRKVTKNDPKSFNLNEHKDEVTEVITKLKRSLCTAFLITEAKSTFDEDGYIMLASEKIRFSDIDTKFSGTSEETRLLFDVIEEYSVSQPINCSSGIHLGSKSNTKIICTVWQYEFTSDLDAATKEPLFSYTVVDQLINRNIGLSWNNALIGELETGRILFSVPHPNTSGQISLGEHLVHNFFAGSRAGKGLQTMGHLANLAAEGRPIFYIDRKPDMGAMFAEITKGNMFLVNGGQLQDDIDYLGTFAFRSGADDFHDADGTPIMLKGWDKRLPKNLINLLTSEGCDVSDDLEEELSQIKSADYYGGSFKLADLVYLRAVYFCIALICLRTKFKSNDEIYSNLGGSDGIAIIIDEFTNWHDNFGIYFTESGRLLKLLPDVKTFNDIKKDLLNEKKRDSAENMKRLWGLTGRPYMYDFVNCIERINNSVSEKLKAGLQGADKASQNWITDIYLIGQYSPQTRSYDCNIFNWGAESTTGARKVNVITDVPKPTPDIIRKTLSQFKQDWFLGRVFLGQEKWDSLPSSKDELTKTIYEKLEHKRCWLYTKNTQDVIDSADFSKMHFEVMKPYLVLNNCIEPNFDEEENMRPEERPLNAQFFRNAVSNIGLDLWKNIRLKHTTSPQTARNPIWGEINEGTGFVGLVKKTMKAGGKYTGENDYLTVLEKSANIANYVARKCGYADWKEFLFDFTPTGLFDVNSLERALEDPTYNFQSTENVRKRAKSCTFCDSLYPELLHGSMSADETATESELTEDSLVNSPEFQVNLNRNTDEEFSNEDNTKEIPPVENKGMPEEDLKCIEAWKKELDRQALNELVKSNKQIEDAFKVYVDREIKANAFEGEDLEEFRQGTNEMLQGYLDKNKAKIYEFRDNLLAKAEAENYKTVLATSRR